MKYKWPLTPLGDVLTERRETPSGERLSSGRVRIIEKINFGTGRIQLRLDGSTRTRMILVLPGDLVISGINAAKGAIAVYDPNAIEPVAATIHYGAYIPDSSRVDVGFLWWMLRSRVFQELLREYVPGGIKTELKAKRLLPVPVPLPPLAEQRRAVARIEELATQIHEARSLRSQAAEEAEALGKFSLSAFVGREAVVRPLRELCTQITDGEHATPPRIDERQVPLATAKNVRDGHLDMRVTDFVSRETAEKCWKRCQPKDGDVLMVCVGATIGRVCRLVAPPEMVIVRSVAMLRCDQEVLEPRYLEYALESRGVQNQIWDLVKQAAQPCLYLNRIERLSISVPSLPEQHRVVSEMDALQAEVDRLKALQAETTTELNALLPSILDRAFKGEL